MNVSNPTIINSQGKVLFFNYDDFINKIVKEKNCFICGAGKDMKPFNDEHVIPDWILRKFKMHSKSITLPNGTTIKYGHYKIPCCQECNSELGKTYEIPISELLSYSYAEICKKLKEDTKLIQLLFKWLSLIFIKTHLKDTLLLQDRNVKNNSGMIGDDYYWSDIHHIHCIARSHYTSAIISPEVFGTICVFPVIISENIEKFDFVDSQAGKTIMVNLKDFCIIVVLNDSCASSQIFSEYIHMINAPLSPFQIREIVAHFNYINLNLKYRPVYKSIIKDGNYTIIGEIPETNVLVDKIDRVFSPGEFLKYYVMEMIGDIDNRETILDEIGKGKRNYLIDENGKFKNYNLQ
jgi:hypothetical protein